jgi:FMN reductase
MSAPLVAVSSGDSATSKTRALAVAALDIGGGGLLVDLVDLSADGLLGRHPHPEVDHAVAAASAADVLVLATPVYRATYSGTLKAFLDRFPADALHTTAVVLCATAATPAHFLALDTGGRALVASLGGWTVPTVVYATGQDFAEGVPGSSVLETLRTALGEARALARSSAVESDEIPKTAAGGAS